MVPQEKIDRLKELLIDQTVVEFERAALEGINIDPRRLVAAMKLIEASDPKAFTPGVPLTDQATGIVSLVTPAKPKDDPADLARVRKAIAAMEARGFKLPFPNPPDMETPTDEPVTE
jgi:hypothetical protein